MGLGLGLAGAADGAQQGFQQLIAQKLMQQKTAEDNRRALVAEQQKQQQLDQTDRERQDVLKETAYQHQLMAESRNSAESDRRVGLANTLGDQIPAGATLAPTDPGVGMLQTGGRGALLQHQDPTLASTALAGQSTLPGDAQPKASQMLMTQNAGHAEQFLKLPSANQQNTLADNTRADTAETDKQRHELAMEQAAMARANRPPTEASPQPLIMKGPDGKDHAVQFVHGVAHEIPLPEGYRKPNATLDNRLSSAEAVSQTGNDIIAKLSDPQYAAQVGPVMGRANSLGDLIGNPPPEFSELSGLIESYALANMSVHGMRSAQGAQIISKLLDQKHTPESLIATIKGLQGFGQHLQNNAGGGAANTGRGAPPAAPAGGSAFKVVGVRPGG